MFTIIGAMAELESSLISERVTAGMRAAESRGDTLDGLARHSASSVKSRLLPRPQTSASVRSQKKIAGPASRGIIGKITKRARATQPQFL